MTSSQIIDYAINKLSKAKRKLEFSMQKHNCTENELNNIKNEMDFYSCVIEITRINGVDIRTEAICYQTK